MIQTHHNKSAMFAYALMTVFMIFGSGCGGEAESRQNSEAESGQNSEAEPGINSNESGFVSIFNGTDLSGWDGDQRFWSVEDERIVGETTAENPAESNTFLIWEEDEPDNFEIRFDYRFVIVSPDEYGNSGIQVRSERFVDEANPELQHIVRGYQPDFAISDWIPGILYEERGRDILARRGQRVSIDSQGNRHEERFAEEDELGEYIRHTEWNRYHVHANGDTIRSSVNGRLMHELIDQSPEARSDGVLAFQVHSGPPMRVEIRDVELRYVE